jgi:hypothetical protein
MTSPDDESIDGAWDILERRLVLPTESPFQQDLDAAATHTHTVVSTFVTSLGQVPVDGEVMGKITTLAVRTFIESLQSNLKGRDLVGLLSLVLEGQGLEGPELKGFIRALPDKLLQRILDSVLGAANGIQALMAIEWHYRQGRLFADYSLGVTSQGQVYAKVPRPNDEEIVLYLDDRFEGIPPKE